MIYARDVMAEREARTIVYLGALALMLVFLGLIKLFKGNFLGITYKNFEKFFITFGTILFVGYILALVTILLIRLK